jgi:capsular exopolysaccharide synthesis family protein
MNVRPIASAEIGMPPSSTENLPSLDLGEILLLLRTHKLTIFGTAALTLTIVALALAFITPTYSATSYVILDQRANTAMDSNAVVSGLTTDPNSIETQVQVLQSRNLAGKVADTLKLADDPNFNPPADAPPSGLHAWLDPVLNAVNSWFPRDSSTPPPAAPPVGPRDAIVNRLLANLTVGAQGRSAAIEIKFQWLDPVMAAAVANAFADGYVADQLAYKNSATQQASQWLSERLEQLSAQTRTSERAVEQYKATSNLTDTANGGSVLQQQVSALSTQLIGAQADLAQQEARYEQMVAMKESGRGADVSQAVASSLISQLRQQETELLRQEAELSSRYGPLHPKMVDLQSQKKNLAGKIDEEVRRVIETVKNDVEVARARVVSLKKNLDDLTARLDAENLARVKLGELSASATSSRAVYDTLLGRFKGIEGRQEIQMPDARVASRAIVPNSPSFPNKLVFFGAALPGGLLLGLLLALASRSLEAGFLTRVQVENYLALPLISAIPEMSWRDRRKIPAAEMVIAKPGSSYAESIRALHIWLNTSKGARPKKIVLVTSSVPSEGKSTVAVSLARIAARAGKRVIVLDADFRCPKIAKAIGAKNQECGILEALNGDKPLEACLRKDKLSEALFLTAAQPISNPSDLIASEQMTSLIGCLAQCCDLLIIDSSPVLPVNDARILGPLADAVVFVLRWRQTPREAAVEAVRALTDIMAPVAGIVLTRTDESQFLTDSYGWQKYREFKKYYTA